MHKKSARHVDRENSVPVLQLDPFERSRSGDAGVVDEDVDLAKVLLSCFCQVGYLPRIGDVAGHCPGLAPLLTDLIGQGFDLIDRPGTGHHRDALIRQGSHDFGSDASSPSGDYGSLAFQTRF